jgi:enoyl-CoA hydratase
MALVLFERIAHGAGKIVLNDPDNLNAMGEEMAKEFSALVDLLRADKKPLTSIILTGAGRAFSAGGRLDMLDKKRSISAEENRALMLAFYSAFLSVLDLNIPLVAAINGHAVGAGLCLACACDVRLASNGAKFGITFTRLGLHPGMGATYFIPQIIGTAAARELMITGRMIEAPEALKIGMVSEVVEPARLMAAAEKLAGEIAECGPCSVREVLRSLRGDPKALQAALEREAKCQSESYAGAEFAEGVTAAREKRKPAF